MMRPILLRTAALCGALAAAACTQPDGSTAIGAVGSPAWMATANPAAKTATYRANCESYGFTPDTPDMARCIQDEAGDHRAGAAANMAALGQVSQQPRRTTTTTNCTPVGYGMSCTSY